MGQQIGERYQIIKPLGSGAFGETFLAKDTHDPDISDCVVKQLKPENKDHLEIGLYSMNYAKSSKSQMGQGFEVFNLFLQLNHLPYLAFTDLKLFFSIVCTEEPKKRSHPMIKH